MEMKYTKAQLEKSLSYWKSKVKKSSTETSFAVRTVADIEADLKSLEGCENPDITSFQCLIAIDGKKEHEQHSVRVCSEHEKAFDTLGNKEMFVN